jgi:OmpA-OmpF porin, OOP family
MTISSSAFRWWTILAPAFLLSFSCLAQSADYPAEAAFMTQWGTIRHHEYESWGVETIPAYGENQVKRYGHHWDLWVGVPGFKFGDRPALWASVKPYVLKAGWTVASENPNGGLLVVLHYNLNGVEAWANAGTDNEATSFYMKIIEVVPPPISLALKEPGATPEKINPRSDFPYLMPLPGSDAHSGQDDNSPFRVTPKGASEEVIVANGSISRAYSLKGLSQELFARVYHDALLKAGWTIERETDNAEVIVAHYSKNGRNLWAYLNCHGSDYTIQVGKEGAPDQLKNSLTTQCHTVIYGVLFDFNKSTLQPASDGPLQQVAALMAANPLLKIEVQGHTDNVGGDDYNQKLSEARANSVMAWLTQHGVAANRMTAKGYGKTKPIADNNSDEGRMKNRRVEIANLQCTAR